MSARRPRRRLPLPRTSRPTTPVPPRLRSTSYPHCSSCCATRALVRCSSKPSSGCLWMSRRTSTKAAAEPRKVSRRVFMCGISLGLQADGAGNAAVAGGLGLIELRGFGQRHGRRGQLRLQGQLLAHARVLEHGAYRLVQPLHHLLRRVLAHQETGPGLVGEGFQLPALTHRGHILEQLRSLDRKSTRLNSSHLVISYAVFCLKKKKECSLPHSPQSFTITTSV